MNHFTTLILLCLGIAVSGACRADTATPGETYRATVGDDGVQHVRIEGGNYYFKPDHVVVQVNIPVELTVSVSKGIIPHSLVIQAPEAGISVDKSLSSEAINIRFTPTTAGKYSFYCDNKLLFFPSHRKKGMEGVLEVVQ